MQSQRRDRFRTTQATLLHATEGSTGDLRKATAPRHNNTKSRMPPSDRSNAHNAPSPEVSQAHRIGTGSHDLLLQVGPKAPRCLQWDPWRCLEAMPVTAASRAVQAVPPVAAHTAVHTRAQGGGGGGWSVFTCIASGLYPLEIFCSSTSSCATTPHC